MLTTPVKVIWLLIEQSLQLDGYAVFCIQQQATVTLRGVIEKQSGHLRGNRPPWLLPFETHYENTMGQSPLIICDFNTIHEALGSDRSGEGESHRDATKRVWLQ